LGRPFPALWVAEPHADGHWHGHLLVPEDVPDALVVSRWPHGGIGPPGEAASMSGHGRFGKGEWFLCFSHTKPNPPAVGSSLDNRVSRGHLSQFTAAGCDALVFTGAQGGSLRRSRFRAWHWVPATRTAGLAGLPFHDLRHTFVALTIAAGADPKRVSVRAGHSSVAFTLDRYGHLYESDEDDLMRLDALLEGTQPTPDATVVSLEGRS
jgi:hypothetical protein